MITHISHKPVGINKVIAFIDAGYLKSNLGKQYGDNNLNFYRLRSMLQNVGRTQHTSQLARVYYYDGKLEESDTLKYRTYQ
jgi:hypothetical protein